MFLSTKLSLKPMFEDLNNYIFHSKVSRIDTSDPKASADTINCWVDEKMNHMVKNITDLSEFH